MATMKSTTVVSKVPNGTEADELDLIARRLVEVKVLGKNDTSTWIRLIHSDGKPDGWVPSNTVDEAGQPDPTIDRDAFAFVCLSQADSFGISGHYLLGVAQLRSKISGGSDATGVGPFRLNAAEWAKYGKDAEFNYDFDVDAISEWSAQCSVFALATFRTQVALALADALGKNPNAVELYLAQMVGVKPAAAAIKAPTTKILDGAAAGDLPPGAASAADILTRYAALLKDGENARTWQIAEPIVFAALKDALDKTADLVPKPAKPSDVVVKPIKPGNSVTVQAPDPVFGPFTKALWQQYCDVLGFRESGNDYTSVNQFNFAGRWQFGCGALIDTGHVQPGTKTARGGAPNSNWLDHNGVSSLATWRSTPPAQDAAMIKFTKQNFDFLTHRGMTATDVPRVAGLLAAAHLKGAGNALALLQGHVTQDANGTTTLSYYRLLNLGMGGNGQL